MSEDRWSAIPADLPDGDYIVAGLMKCCHPGAKITLIGHRHKGEWVLPLDHDIDLRLYMDVPPLPAIMDWKGGVQ